jgi:hypothetical protein
MTTLTAIKSSIKTLRSLDKGLSRHGDQLILTEDFTLDTDGYLQTNLLKPKFFQSDKHKAYQFILDSNKPFLVSESPSFREYPQYVRLGWYSYKWSDGLFGNTNSPPDRWKQFQKDTGIVIKDWNSPGDHILIMGQKEGDSSLNKLYEKHDSFYDWVENIIIDIRKYSDRKIVIRPHPRNLGHGVKLAKKLSNRYRDIIVSEDIESDGISGGASLERDLARAYCVITYNSLSAVEAVTRGIPTYAFDDGSMIWPIAHKDITQIENLKYDTDITQWCYDIAYTQWTIEENRKGISWAHLKPLVFKD